MHTEQHIEELKVAIERCEPGQKQKYLSGIRDGLDLAALIDEDSDGKLAANDKFRQFLDYLDKFAR